MSNIRMCRDPRDWDRVPNIRAGSDFQDEMLPIFSFMVHEDICELADSSEDWAYDFYRLLDRADWTHREFDDAIELGLRYAERKVESEESKSRRDFSKEEILRVMKACSRRIAEMAAASWLRTQKDLLDEVSSRALDRINTLVDDKRRLQQKLDDEERQSNRKRYSDDSASSRDREDYRGRDRFGHSYDSGSRDRQGGRYREEGRSNERYREQERPKRSSTVSDRRGPRGEYSYYGKNLDMYEPPEKTTEVHVTRSRIDRVRQSVTGGKDHANSVRFAEFNPENYDKRFEPPQTQNAPQAANSSGFNEDDYDLQKPRQSSAPQMQSAFRQQSTGSRVMNEINQKANYDTSVETFEDLQRQQDAQFSHSVEERLYQAQAELDQESKNDPATKAGVRRMAYNLDGWIYKEPRILAPTKGTEMDQAEHGAIYDATEGMQRKPLTKEVKRALTLAQAAFRDDVKPEEIQMHIIEETSLTVTDNELSMASGSTREATIKSKEIAAEKGVDARIILRNRFCVNRSIVGREVTQAIQEVLKEVQSLSQLRNLMRTTLVKAEKDFTAESPEASDLRAAVEFINNQVTRDLNDYLIDVMGIASREAPLFTSFMDDIDEATDVIENNLGRRATEAFAAFCHNYICGVIDLLKSEKIDVVKDARDYLNIDETTGMVIWPKGYVTTNIPFTLRELGYSDLQKPCTVSRSLTPMLDALIIRDRDVLQDRFGSAYMNQALVTRCGALIRVYPHPVEKTYVLVREPRS